MASSVPVPVASDIHEHPSGASKWTTLAVLALAIWLAFYSIRSYLEYRCDMAFSKQHGCERPPELPNRWPLGINWIMQLWKEDARGEVLEFMSRVADEYPTNMLSQFFLFGPRYFHVVAPQNVEAILSSSFADYGFGVRADVFRPLCGAGIFTEEGPAWKASRTLLRRHLVRVQPRALDGLREHVDNLLARLPADGEGAAVVDLQPLFYDLTLDTASALLLGKSIYALRQGAAAATPEARRNARFAASFETVLAGLSRRFRMVPFHNLYRPKAFHDACSFIHGFVDGYVADIRSRKMAAAPASLSEKSGGGGGDDGDRSGGLVGQIIDMNPDADDTAIRSHVLHVLLGGRDTTASCLSWTFRLLVRHPPVFRKLRGEITQTIGAAPRPTRDDMRCMPYLAQVVKESLRLYPPVAMNVRQAVRTTVLPTGGGRDGRSPVLVRRGECAGMSAYITARRTSVFGPDAREFRPERWDSRDEGGDGEELQRCLDAFFAFSAGPRRCIGEDFALAEVSYVVVALCQAFQIIEILDEDRGKPLGSERQNTGLVISCMEGCKVRMSRCAGERGDEGSATKT
ncbi:cytochrome P450 [Lasiosphaeria miniovina]|uniref:Cytochrome P450 n=1 Tax=Lasiosphaeria miniovina TaxID=1954250 RepID=A0AA40AAZ2_9PEZI|nr:cytochrome P450 [Lasiosphaeria miniovina]KAK0712479.1 cytochrome P450 [Lasiosphaeria miniovina]